MKRYITASLVSCLVGYAAGASAVEPAAVLRQPQGKVFVSQGGAMTPARAGMSLYAGNRVIAVSGGRAEITYADGCIVTLPENSLLAVKGSDQCRLGQARIRATGGFRNPRIGQAGSLSSGGSSDSPVADFKRPQGSVLVNETPAWNNRDARRDDEIVTAERSEVTVAFRGCEVDVGPQEQVTVDALREQCKTGVYLASGEDSDVEIAIIKQPQGSVGVDGVAARNDMGVKTSNQVVTGSGSKVTVVFKGCEVVVGEKEKVKVEDLVTKCKGGLWADAGAGGASGGAGAGAASTAGAIGTAILIGGAFGGPLIGALVGHDDECASPPCNP